MKTNNNFHILIVDDEKFNIELAAAYLQEEGYKLSFAMNALSAIETVMTQEISLILLDINMPGKDGFHVCRLLKDDVKSKDIPVVFLTAQTDIKYISRAFEVGGVDYISKPFNGAELVARVKTHLQNVAYLEEIKEKQSKLAQLTITDPLTKIYNTLYFDAQIRLYQKREENFWFLYIKIDRFEKINQVYGFHAANKIIKLFSKVLEKCSYSNMTVAKLYGISFGILANNYELETIKELYTQIVLEVAKNKELAKVITFSTVLYNSKKSSITLPLLYKRVQNAMSSLEDEAKDKYLFIS